MNATALIIGAFIGAIAGVLGTLLANRIFASDRKNAKLERTLVAAGVAILAIAVWALVPKPFLSGADDFRSRLEAEMIGSPMGQIFVSIKNYDKENYDNLLDELVKAAEANEKDPEAVSLLAAQAGAKYTARYIGNASAADIRAYIETYTAFLTTIVDTDPLVVCKLENPAGFGATDQNAVDKVSGSGVIQAMDRIVKSAVQNPVPYDEPRAQADFSQFLSSYGEKHPDHMETLSSAPDPLDREGVRKFARAYLAFYKDLLLLDAETGAGIYKLVRSSV